MSQRETKDIVGVHIDPVTIEQINDQIISHTKASTKRPMVVFKPYVEFLALAAKNTSIRDMLNAADYTIADATSVQWAGSYLYGKPNIRPNLVSTFWSLAVRLQSKKWRSQIFPEKMGGVDMTYPLLRKAQRDDVRVGIIGGPRDTAGTKQKLLKLFPKLQLREVWSGYSYTPTTVERLASTVAVIQKAKVDILFVALGFPLQEEFIVKYKEQLGAKVLIGEGGSFDYDQLGGSIKRAPHWVRSIGMEWFWRLLRQPSRLKRQFAIPRFIFAVRAQKKLKN